MNSHWSSSSLLKYACTTLDVNPGLFIFPLSFLVGAGGVGVCGSQVRHLIRFATTYLYHLDKVLYGIIVLTELSESNCGEKKKYAD
jgi:hypothetical protein